MSGVQVQLSGFLETKKIDKEVAASELKLKVKYISIFLLVDTMTENVERKISKIRLDSQGIVRRVEHERDIELLIRSNYARESIIITDKENKESANKIGDNLQQKNLNVTITIVE